MVHSWRAGSDSRCCNRNGAPYVWHQHVDLTHESVVALTDWLGSLAPFARSIEEGEIDELFEAAAQGMLMDSADERTPIKPVQIDPEIYELRRTALSKRLRFYHGEPDEHPRMLAALHRHIKSGSDTQQDEIEFAADRFDNGYATAWISQDGK